MHTQNRTSSRPIILSQGRNRTKARICLIQWQGKPAVEKDYSQRGLLVRCLLGPLFLNREQRALEHLAGMDGVPAVHARPSRDRLIMERLDGKPLLAYSGSSPDSGHLPGDFFVRLQQLVAALHRRGVAQGDIGAGDVLVRRDGSPALIDFSVSLVRNKGLLGIFAFHNAARQDRRRLARLRKRFAPAGLTRHDRLLLDREPLLHQCIRQVGRLRPGHKG
ncbi:MAG: hypothetical protein ACE5HD_05480 [Acidobacteriota bacterium]